jgi:hypothetical protein
MQKGSQKGVGKKKHGELKTHILELESPAYEALGGDRRYIAYKATRLGGSEIIENELLYAPTLFVDAVAPPTSFPVSIINNSGIPDDQAFVTIKASLSGKDCFMDIDKTTGKGTCQVTTASTKSSLYTYRLTDLPLNSGSYDIELPKVESGRLYFSFYNKLEFAINFDQNNNNYIILDPDGYKMRDVNYYTIYDKVEFTFTGDGTWINPTAVDFFSIPIRISQPGLPSGLKDAGFTKDRMQIRDEVKGTFENTAGQKSGRHPLTLDEWNKLVLNYEGYDQQGYQTETFLRLMSPGKAMVEIGTNLNERFDPNYLSNEGKWGFDYIGSLWEYYNGQKNPSHQLVIDCRELEGDTKYPLYGQLDDYTWTGQVDASQQFVFESNSTIKAPPDIKIGVPESRAFFAGATSSFDAPNHSARAIIVRELTSAFEVGLLPNDGTMLNKAYFEDQRSQGKFYADNSHLAADKTGPWFDLYSKALHEAGGSDQPIYTFAYDDALGQDGTLHDPLARQVVITIGDMKTADIPIPDPYKIDPDNTYNVTMIVGGTGSKHYDVYYDNPPVDTDSPLTPQKPYTFTNVEMPLKVTFNSDALDIYVDHPMVRPQTTLSDGIVINRNIVLKDPEPGSTIEATVVFPGPP